MTATILDGRPLGTAIQASVAEQVTRLKAAGCPTPRLSVVLIGADAGSVKYAHNKANLCRKVGMECDVVTLEAAATQDSVSSVLRSLSQDPKVHGIFVEFPLPPQLDAQEVLSAIPAHKDVEGMTLPNVGRLTMGTPLFMPTTPAAVLRILQHYGIPLAGRHAVVVGRSNVVGRPLAAILLAQDATVTVCHSKTRDLAGYTRSADVLVVACGRPRLIGADMVAAGAAVIDVGTNYTPEGLVGDVDTGPVAEKACAITPVPGGVGPVTTAMILDNVLQSALLQSRC